MNSLILVLCIVGVGLAMYCAVQIDRIETDINDIKDIIPGQADRLSQELFTDYGCLTEQSRACLSKIDSAQRSISLEIACLATKNNEDIKRMKGDYTVGDVLRFGGIKMGVFGKDTLDDGRTRWKLFGENGEEYRIYTDDMPRDLEFLGHRDLFD